MLKHVDERNSNMVWECVLRQGWGRGRAMEAHDGNDSHFLVQIFITSGLGRTGLTHFHIIILYLKWANSSFQSCLHGYSWIVLKEVTEGKS